MSKLAYLESISRDDEEYRVKSASDFIPGMKGVNQGSMTKAFVEQKGSRGIPRWVKIGAYGYLALNPYVPPRIRYAAAGAVIKELKD